MTKPGESKDTLPPTSTSTPRAKSKLKASRPASHKDAGTSELDFMIKALRKEVFNKSFRPVKPKPTINEIAKTIGEQLFKASMEDGLYPDRLRRVLEYGIEQVQAVNPRFKTSVSTNVSNFIPKAPPKDADGKSITWDTHKEKGQNAPAFVQKHYAQWLGKGLARVDLKQIDPPLYDAIGNYLKDKKAFPPGFDLPTKTAKLAKEGEAETPDEVKEARRIIRRWETRVASSRKASQRTP